MACKARHVKCAARFSQKGGKEEQELMITISAGVFSIQAIVLSLETRKKIPRS